VQYIKEAIRENKFFLIPFILVLIITAPVLAGQDKLEVHLFLNRYHSNFGDGFFRSVTKLGDGSIPFILGAILALFSFRKALLVAAGGTLAGLIAQFMKRILFPQVMRPYHFFRNHEGFHFVRDYDLYSSHSFPSGHAATIFAMALCMAAISRNKWIKVLFFILAIIVAYSRVYLSQHFLTDIYFGSILGMLSALGTYTFLYSRKSPWLDNSFRSLLGTRTHHG
jgi:membrane-associated phospholipid phosphatase